MRRRALVRAWPVERRRGTLVLWALRGASMRLEPGRQPLGAERRGPGTEDPEELNPKSLA